MIGKDIFENSKNAIADRFLTLKSKEYASFAEREQAKNRVGGQIKSFEDGLVDRQQKFAALREKVKSFSGVDIPRSIQQAMRNTGLPIERILPDVVPAFILKTYGPDIVALEEAELSAFEKNVADFRKENRELIREIAAEEAAQAAGTTGN